MSGGGGGVGVDAVYAFILQKIDLLRNNQSIKNTTMQYDSRRMSLISIVVSRKKSKIISDQINLLIFSGHSFKDNYMRVHTYMYVPKYLTLCYLASKQYIMFVTLYYLLTVCVFSLYHILLHHHYLHTM